MSQPRPSDEEVARYYDDQVASKVQDYVVDNPRVASAIASIVKWVHEPPGRVLDVGCGVGYAGARLKQEWPQAMVRGIDLSPVAVDAANRLFGATNLTFDQMDLMEMADAEPVDLVVLMDVYEHVKIEARVRFHDAIAAVLTDTAMVFLSFPTPGYQAFLRASEPHKIQPVDEDVSLVDLDRLAADIGGRVVRFEARDVWRRGDYAHALIARPVPDLAPIDAPPGPMSLLGRVSRRARRIRADRHEDVRRRHVVERLGQSWLDSK